MDVARPYTAVSPSLDCDVLVVLARTTRPLTGREIARLATRGSQRGINDVLHRLVGHGLIDAQEAGPAMLYTLNRDHIAAPAVEVLADLGGELLGRLQAAIEAWEVAPIHASLFGSAARGDGDTKSDIDLFIVRPNDVDEEDARWRDQLDRLAKYVRRSTGNHAAISEVAAADLAGLQRENRPVVNDLREDAVTLVGPPPSTLFGSAP